MSLKTTHAPLTFNIDRLSHAYIVDDAIMCVKLAMAIICSSRDGERPCMKCKHCDKAIRDIHPDIITVKRLDDKREIVVEQIRKLQQDIFIVPNEASHKVYFVLDADSMNRSSQNAFLRILEEPPSYVVFLLCTANPAALLPTVRSRCIELKARQIADSCDVADAGISVDSCISADAAGSAESVAGSSGSIVGTGEPVADTIGTVSGEADVLNEVVNAFLTSLGNDNHQLMKCMFRLEKFDKSTFSVFLTSTREQIVLSLRDNNKLLEGSGRRLLVYAESVLVKAEEMLALNVNTGHISGMICASLLK